METNNRDGFQSDFERIIIEWRKPPARDDRTRIRILPGEGLQIGWDVPIEIHHVYWWEKGLRLLWSENYIQIQELRESLLAIRLIILHSIEYLSYWIFNDENEVGFENEDFIFIRDFLKIMEILV
ncbi:MAG: hypothetical protein ACTSX4_06905 [Candidatus Helarchaeota archaeon]